MPFAGYKNHADCVSKNQQARDPDAYCASIARAIEGKDAAYEEAFAKALEGEDTDWLDTKEWHNDRTHSAFINDSLVDFQGDRVTREAQVLAMPHYAEEGFLEWMHGKEPDGTKGPPVKIGRPIGWRVKDQKVEVRWGVYDRDDMMGLPSIDAKWAEIQKGGTFSMTFLPVTEYIVEEGGQSVLEISLVHLQSVGFVGPWAASPGAVSTGKASMIVMKALDPDGGVSRETARATLEIEKAAKDFLSVVRGQTLKMGSEYAPAEGPPMAEDDKMKKAAEEAVKAAAAKAQEEETAKAAEKAAEELKSLEAKLAEAKAKAAHGKPDEKQPPEGGCPEGKEWDPDAGECVDKEEGTPTEEAIKALQAEARETRTLLKRLLKEALPKPEDVQKEFRTEVEKALEGVEDADIRAAILSAADKVAPPEELGIEDKTKALIDELVGAKVQEIQSAQTKAMDEFGDDIREKMGLDPVRKPHGKPDTSGGTGATSAEAAAEKLVKEANEAAQERQNNPALRRW